MEKMKKLRASTHKLRMPEEISPEALTNVKIYLRDQHQLEFTKDYEAVEKMMDTVDQIGIEWVTPRGTWPKRLSRALKHAIGKVPSDVISKCGQMAKSSCQRFGETVELKISRTVHWKQGDYGDYDSCFFGCRSAAPYMIFHHDGFALTLSSEEGERLGRAWCVPWRDHYVVFNSYAVNGECVECTTFARLLMALLGRNYYRKVRLLNRGYTEGVLWINNCYGFLVGDDVHNIEAVDLDLTVTCEECEADFTDESAGYWYEKSFRCAECSKTCYNCESVIPCGEEIYSRGDRFCRECWEEIGTYCDRCDDPVQADDVHDGPDNEPHCEACFNHRFVICFRCGDVVWGDEALTYQADLYCQGCYDLLIRTEEERQEEQNANTAD